MDNEIKVSVIVPAYNAEKYIERCLESLINQSIGNGLEIIVVNDGSTDQTQRILEFYESINKNIRVYNTANKGVSHARNFGIQCAKGKYITFVDADDWLELDCYKRMYDIAVSEKVDIVAAGIYIDSEKGNIISRKLVDNNVKVEQKKALKEYLYGDMDVHIVNKLFKREVINEHRFDTKIRIAEDRLFLFECLLESKKLFFMKDCFYHYFQNQYSVMNQTFSEKNLDNIVVGRKIIKIIKQMYPDLTPFAKSMYMSMECRLYGEIYDAKMKEKYKNIYIILKRDIKTYNILKNRKYASKKHMIAFVLARISPSLYNFLRSNPIMKFKR